MNVKNMPLVSVIITTYKRRVMLGRAIDSVLSQSYENIEIIIVDDNDESSKYRLETEKFMDRYKGIKQIKYIKHKLNQNGAVARNTGIKYSEGKYIAFLDDDDQYMPEKIKLQVNKIEGLSKEYGGVYSGFIQVNKKGILFKSNSLLEGDLRKQLLLMEGFSIGSGSNLFIRKEVLEELNGFDKEFYRHQDWEFLIRFFRKYKIAVVDDRLLKVYVDSRINRPNGDEFLKVKNQFLDKFKEDIYSFPPQIRNKVYKNHLLDAIKVYLRARELKKATVLYKKAKGYSKITAKDKSLLMMEVIDGFLPIKDKFKIIIRKYNRLL